MVDISILVAVYNHEKYIRQAIESILMQKGDFSYEVFVGEDCSTDGTRDILKSMEPDLPEEFHILYREQNMGRKGKGNFEDLQSRLTGKYVIVLEGDDFWIYPYKLQRQFEFLEQHPEFLAVAHNTEIVGEHGEILDEDYPECKTAEYTVKDFGEGLLPGQTTTILFRNYHAYPTFSTHLPECDYPGDRYKAFLLVANGRVACIQEKWSAYRHVTSSGDSFSARMAREAKRGIVHHHGERMYYQGIYEYAMENPVRPGVLQVTEQLYLKLLFRYAVLHYDHVSFHDLWKAWKNAKYFWRACLLFVTYPSASVVRKIRRKLFGCPD